MSDIYIYTGDAALDKLTEFLAARNVRRVDDGCG